MNIIEQDGFLTHALLPQFKKKILDSKDIIAKSLNLSNNPYIAVSWGKDSIVMLHMIQTMCSRIKVINIGDPLEDLQNNYSEVKDEYCFLFPHTNYEAIYYDENNDGGFYPQVKNLQNNYDLAFIGCRKEESKYRAIAINKYGVIHQYKSGFYRCFPLAYWSTMDIWAYIFKYDLHYLKSYDLHGYQSRTAVVHNFDLHRGKHQEALIRHGAMAQLKQQAPEYFNMYADLYPEIKNYV